LLAPSAIVATAVLEALLLLQFQVCLGLSRDLARALCWALIGTLACAHLHIFGFGAWVPSFWFCCCCAIYCQLVFQFLTLAAYAILICHFILANLA
jgi:hypothetical protein